MEKVDKKILIENMCATCNVTDDLIILTDGQCHWSVNCHPQGWPILEEGETIVKRIPTDELMKLHWYNKERIREELSQFVEEL